MSYLTQLGTWLVTNSVSVSQAALFVRLADGTFKSNQPVTAEQMVEEKARVIGSETSPGHTRDHAMQNLDFGPSNSMATAAI
jgi:hypothetical protein